MVDAIELHSGDYVERYKRKPLRRVSNLAAKMALRDGDELADFACGTGMLLHAIGARKGLYHGIDFSPDFIAAAREWAERSALQNWEFHCTDIIDFCGQNPQRFDVATALDFSEHVNDEEATEIFNSIRRSMKPGGTLYVHTPNREFFIEQMKERGILKQFPEHIAVRSPAQMRRLLVEAGFNQHDIAIQSIPHYNILKVVHSLGSLPIIGKYLRARLWITARS
jgi:2-polyprenyl-6-hydroxyphenyl methylase / 3-demethylubiquinone-9 3-methyltransferase